MDNVGNISIAVLEDDPVQAASITEQLESEIPGVEVVVVESEFAFQQLVERWQTAAAEIVDLVLVDQMLRFATITESDRAGPKPEHAKYRGGDRSIELLRSHPTTETVPVILHSILPGETTGDDHTFYVQKTADSDTLLLTVRGVLAANEVPIPDPPILDDDDPGAIFDPDGATLLNATSVSAALTAGLLLARVGGWLENRVGLVLLVVSTLLSTVLLFVTKVFHANPIRDVRRAAAIAIFTFVTVVVVTAGAHAMFAADEESDGAPSEWESELETVLRANGLWDDDTEIQVFVRPLGGGDEEWSTGLNVVPGQAIQVAVRYLNAGTTTGKAVAVGSNLAKYTSYIEGSTILSNGNHPDGTPAQSDNVTRGGIDIGDYKPGADAYITFDVAIDPITAFERCGEYRLALVGIAGAEKQHSFFNTAEIAVDVDC